MKTRMTAAFAAVLACASAWAGEPIITTFAGGGPGPGIGDGGPATSARLLNPIAVAADATGNVYVADGYYFGNNDCRIRKIAPNGIISTIAGNGTTSGSGENVPATSVAVCPHGGLAVDAQGNVFVGEYARVRRITPGGLISTVAGTGSSGYSGDGGKATLARFADIRDVAVDANGHLYIADGSSRVRKVDGMGIVRTVAGNGNHSASGDGGPATAAGMNPQSVAFDSAGRLYITDRYRSIRRVTADGIIRTFAGGHFRNDPVALNAQQFYPAGIAIDARNSLFVANRTNFIRVIGANGIQAFVAGPFVDTYWAFGAEEGFSGDGGPAIAARLWEPEDVAVDAAGNLYVADLRNQRVRKITPVAPPRTPAGVGAFAPRVMMPVGSYGEDVAVGDINGDGRKDAILTTSAWGYPGDEPDNDWKLHAFLQQPDGTLAAPIERAMGFGRYLGGLAVADFNEDGRTDAVVTDQNGVHIYRGGANGFGAGILWANVGTAKGAGAVAVADLNRDGHMDVLAFATLNEDGSGTDTGLTLFYGNGLGGVARRRLIQVEGSWSRPLLFDATGDGREDLVLPWDDHIGNDSGLLVHPHDGVDSFGAPYRLHVGERNFVAGRTVGDFDDDGLLDIVVSRDGNAPTSALAYLRQTHPGSFVVQKRWGTYDGAVTLLGRDMNSDGRDDLLVLHSGWSSVGYHQQSMLGGQWWLHDEVKYYQYQSGIPTDDAIAVGDLNHDGCPDVATSDYNYGLQVHYGRRCRVARNGSEPLLPSVIHRDDTRVGAPAASDVVPVQWSVSRTGPGAKAVPLRGGRLDAWLEPARSLFARVAERLQEGWRRVWAGPARTATIGRQAPGPRRALPFVAWQGAPVCRADDPWLGHRAQATAPRRRWW